MHKFERNVALAIIWQHYVVKETHVVTVIVLGNERSDQGANHGPCRSHFTFALMPLEKA